jgi:transcription antitermination factor NusG
MLIRKEHKAEKGTLPEEWFVVYSGLIYRAMDHLDRIGVHYYQPRYRAMLRHTRKFANPKSIETDRALYPGYLFIAAGAGINPKDVDGVTHVLETEPDRYARIPHSFIEWLMDKIAKRAYDDIEVLQQAFKPGARITVKEGPFVSFPGTVEKLLGEKKDHARILVEIFGRSTPVDLDLTDVEAA